MKNIVISIVIIFCIVGGITFVAANNTNQDKKYDISLVQINKNLENEAVLIDVRTVEEYTLSHAENAINIPLDDIQNGVEPEISKDKIVYLYCRSGNRANQAKAILEQKGYLHVINIVSLDKWVAMGGEIQKNTTCKAGSEKC